MEPKLQVKMSTYGKMLVELMKQYQQQVELEELLLKLEIIIIILKLENQEQLELVAKQVEADQEDLIMLKV